MESTKFYLCVNISPREKRNRVRTQQQQRLSAAGLDEEVLPAPLHGRLLLQQKSDVNHQSCPVSVRGTRPAQITAFGKKKPPLAVSKQTTTRSDIQTRGVHLDKIMVWDWDWEIEQ